MNLVRPDARGPLGATALDRLARLAAERGGSVGVDEALALLLHDPEVGYYGRRVGTVGAAGDFSTAATLHPALGGAIAAWARARARELSLPRPVWLIEVGAGSGELADGVLRALPFWERRAFRYAIVESSAPLRGVQERRLGRRADFLGTVAEALQAAGGNALVFSNELVDAFPFRVVERRGGEWLEVRLRVEGRRIAETTGGPVPPPGEWPDAPEGQRCEVRAPYRAWLSEWAPHLRRGRVLTVDYGGLFPDLYLGRRRGTLRGFVRHGRVTGADVWANPGRQDVTADVNFSDVVRWGIELGLAPLSLVTQREFLLGQLPSLARRAARERALAFVLDPEGMGGATLVLEQGPRDAGP